MNAVRLSYPQWKHHPELLTIRQGIAHRISSQLRFTHLKKLSNSGRRWQILRTANELRRLGRKRPANPFGVTHRTRSVRKVQIWQGGEPEWALCLRAPEKPPKTFCFRDNLQESFRFFERLRTASYEVTRSKLPLIDRSRGSKSLPRIGGYFDFSFPKYISTAAAVVMASEFERLTRAYGEVTPTVDLDMWNEDVFRKLFQIGFFEIVGITPSRDDVMIDEGDTRTMQIIGTKNANDLERVDKALQALGEFVNPDGNIPDHIVIGLLTGLAEAMSNVTAHAYPDDYVPEYPHIGQLWIAATADRVNKTLTVVVYDQGITIPVTYPRLQRMEKVVNYLTRALRARPEFDFQNDGTYIRAAMRHGGSRTDQRHRGKGLPQMIDVIEMSGRGKLSVYSRGGWCVRDSDGRLKSGAVPCSIGGTLIEWAVELSQPSAVTSS